MEEIFGKERERESCDDCRVESGDIGAVQWCFRYF